MQVLAASCEPVFAMTGKEALKSQISMNKDAKLRLDMKDNGKCITTSLSTSTWNHCFMGIEENWRSVYLAIKAYLDNSRSWIEIKITRKYIHIFKQFPCLQSCVNCCLWESISLFGQVSDTTALQLSSFDTLADVIPKRTTPLPPHVSGISRTRVD